MANREFYKVLTLILLTWAFVLSIKAQEMPVTFIGDSDTFITVLAEEVLKSEYYILATGDEGVYIVCNYASNRIIDTPFCYYAIMVHLVGKDGTIVPVSNVIGWYFYGKGEESGIRLGGAFADGIRNIIVKEVERQVNHDKPKT